MSDVTGIVERLEPALGPISGAPVPLEGGITNRNFKARLGGRVYMIRLPGKDTELLGISREAERIANQAAAGLGIAPAVVAGDDECLVTEFLECTDVDPDRLRADPSAVARALRAFHGSGTALPTRFWVPELLEDYAAVVARRGGVVPDEYDATRAIAARIADALPLGEPAPCHDDLLPANILERRGSSGHGTMLVDWEYAGMGHPMFDLGNLAVNNEFDEAAEGRLLAAYFGDPVSEGQWAALKLMKIMSDAREAAWGVVQGVISELDFDFAGYAQKHFDRLEAAGEDPRLEGWLVTAFEAFA